MLTPVHVCIYALQQCELRFFVLWHLGFEKRVLEYHEEAAPEDRIFVNEDFKQSTVYFVVSCCRYFIGLGFVRLHTNLDGLFTMFEWRKPF